MWVRFLVVCFLHKTNPNKQKKYLLLREKVAQMPLFKVSFSWVGKFDGFVIIFVLVPTCLLYTSPSPRD